MIRVFQHGDHVAIAEIFSRAVHEIASEVYSREQCLAWSDIAPNHEHWKRRCELKRPFVFLKGATIAGFLELDPDGHIDCAYVHPDHRRQGVVSALARHAVETCFARGIDRVHAEASLCARPMFEKIGFKTLSGNLVNIRGVELLNFKMERLKRAAGMVQP
jgi:ribosomal protein S18 acetylase RimI-like enzyme